MNSLGASAMQGALIKKYHDYRQTVDPTFAAPKLKDWRGMAGVLTGQQNADMQTLANFKGGQGLGATGSSLQGQRAGDLAKYISGTDEYNAGVQTQAERERADTMNKFSMYNKENVAKNVENENILDSKFKAALSASLKGYTGALNQGITHAGQIYNTNLTESPYYYVDPRTQKMQFNSPAAQAAFYAQTKQGYQAPQDGGASYAATMKAAYDQMGHITDPKERQQAAEKYAYAVHFGNKTSNTTYPMNTAKNRATTSGYAGYNPSQYADPYAGYDPTTGMYGG